MCTGAGGYREAGGAEQEKTAVQTHDARAAPRARDERPRRRSYRASFRVSFRVSRLGKAAPHKAPLASRNDAAADAAAAAARQRVCFSATDRQGLEDGGRCGLLPHVTVHCVSVTVARCRYALRVPPPP